MRLLNLLGVQIGPEEDLLGPGEADNARGYWEQQWMVELNDEILAKLGSVWWQSLPAEPGWQRSSDFDELRARARGLLQQTFAGIQLWGWKDPRTTLTLPFWKELVPNARYVICLRNPADAISSIQRRPEPELSVGAWGELWLEYTARALKETQGCTRTLVFYEDFFEDAQAQLARMASLLDLQLPERGRLPQRLADEITQALRHHATSPRELAASWGISPAARTLFLALRAAEDARRAGGGRDAQLPEALGRIAPELWWERHTANDLRCAFAEAQQTTTVLQNEQRELTDAVVQARAEATELRTLLGQEREQFRDQLASAQLELEHTRTELTAAAVQQSETQVGLSTLGDRLQRQGVVLDQLQSSLSWRLTAPLRAIKRAVRASQPARRGSVLLARDQSLLRGMSVSQVWWFALALSAVVAATDAMLPHVVLISLLAAGPFCGLLTGRWAKTAAVGVWAVLLAVLLGFPDNIWGTGTEWVNLGTVATLASLSTLGAALIERHR